MATLMPHEIFRHPECQRVSREILQRPARAVVYGPTGSGVSMFVRAHCDVYWETRSSLMIFADDDVTTTELFDEHPGLRDGLFRNVLVDLAKPWTKSVINIFFKKIPTRTRVVLVIPQLPLGHADLRVISVNTSCPNAMFHWMCACRTAFVYLDPSDPYAFFRTWTLCGQRLSRVVQRYLYGTDVVDHVDTDPFSIRTLEEADAFFEDHTFDPATSAGSIQMAALMADVKSFCDIRSLFEPDPVYPDEPPLWDLAETQKPLTAYTWWYMLHG